MKKLFIVLLCGVILFSNVASAKTIEEQKNELRDTLIQLIIQQIQVLQKQLEELIAKEAQKNVEPNEYMSFRKVYALVGDKYKLAATGDFMLDSHDDFIFQLKSRCTIQNKHYNSIEESDEYCDKNIYEVKDVGNVELNYKIKRVYDYRVDQEEGSIVVDENGFSRLHLENRGEAYIRLEFYLNGENKNNAISGIKLIHGAK